jgi:hypothetical protein
LRLFDRVDAPAAVTVEGIPRQVTGRSPDDPYWDRVDVGLLYGGEELGTATRVELVQLKYSGDPTRSWSIGRLTKNTAKTDNNSVLRKLANAFRAARGSMGASAELRVRLVSNQPVSEAVGTAIEAIVTSLVQASPKVRADVRAVAAATGLDESSLGDLQNFLTAEGADLICEVEIERRGYGEYDRAGDAAKERKVFDRVLLCRRDGRIEGARGRLGAWTAIGPRARA